MKVLIIHCEYQYKGGEETVIAEEQNLLRRAGHEVALLTFQNHGNTLLKVLQMPFNLSAYRKVGKAIRSFGPDVVHVHNLHYAASPSVIYAVKKHGVPLVCTLHNFRLLCPSAILFHHGKAFLSSLHEGFPFTAVRKGVYRNSKLLTLWLAVTIKLHQWLGTWQLPDRFVVLSEHAKEIFMRSSIRFGKEQLVIKPNLCQSPDLQPVQRSNRFVFVGRLSAEKGVSILLRTFSASPHQLVLAGDGPLKEEVIAYSRKYPNIVYAGVLQKSAVMVLLQSATALLFPSIWYEGMPLTIIEAFACGTPVIASKLGVMNYMITPGYDGFLFDADSEPALQNAVEAWVALTPAEKEVYSQNARATYERLYTPQKNTEQLLAIYAAVQKQESANTKAAMQTNGGLAQKKHSTPGVYEGHYNELG